MWALSEKGHRVSLWFINFFFLLFTRKFSFTFDAEVRIADTDKLMI